MSGNIDTTKLEEEGFTFKEIQSMKQDTKGIQDSMSGPGELGLAELLDERRLEEGIPDCAFRHEASFDRIFVYQIEPEEYKTGTYGQSRIILSDTIREMNKVQAPRAIIVSAGLSAMDALYSHGIGLGHRILIIREAPFRLRVGFDWENKPVEVIILTVGDICASEDLAKKRLSGDLTHVVDSNGRHSYEHLLGAEARKVKPTNGY